MNFFAGLLLLLMPEENAFWYVVEVNLLYFYFFLFGEFHEGSKSLVLNFQNAIH